MATLAEPNDVGSMAGTMFRFLEYPIDRANVASKVKEMSWENYAKTILNSPL
ncbi:MAG: hypothetical protein M0D57_13100 [Sphingobacteriales bacterium JAD_PAG50586_3]|nr:MAG: hypothetical protein M0D57_13100 [Sphingobacteriales bacterium JAD_PAG50586_3]